MAIVNAKNQKIEETSDLPDPSDSVMKFLRPIKIGIVTTQNFNGLPNPIIRWTRTQGVCQPFSPEQLEVKPEGQRSWKWSTIHVLPGLNLNTNDRIIFDNVHYKVMQKLDYSRYGYLEYHIVKDFTDEPA